MIPEFRLLGPLAVTVDDRPVVVHATKLRILLASLILRAGEVVPAEVLIDAVWGDTPPATARNTLQVYLGRLRQAVGVDGIIANRTGGYVIDVPQSMIDAGQFRALAGAARAAQADPAAEFELLTAALSRWRGPVLADVDVSPRQRSLVAGLEEERLSATDRRFDVGLRLGRHAELVAELVVVSTEHPLHERFWCQRMVALYHAGRQAESLAAYRAITGRLADQLGIDPGVELRSTHEAILRQTLRPPLAVNA